MFDIDEAEISRVMDLHPPQDPGVASDMDHVRAAYKSLALALMPFLPTSPEKSIAFRKLREALMYSIAALACNQDHRVKYEKEQGNV